MPNSLIDRRCDALMLIVVHSRHKVYLMMSPMESLGLKISGLHSDK